MPLPLPKVVYDVGPGGGITTSMMGTNALQTEQLRNEILKAQAQYAPEMTQAELAQKQALGRLTGQQADWYAPNIQSEIANRNALTKRYNVMTPLEAQELKMKNQFYPELTKADIASKNAMANWRNMGGGYGMGVGQKQIMGLQRQLQVENPDWTPEQANAAASAYLSGENTLADGTQLPPPSGITTAYLDQIAKQGTTAQGLNQQRFAATTDAILNAGDQYMPSVTKYSGLLGRGQGSIDAVSSALGQNSPDYNQYVYFTRQYVPYAAGEMMRALGVNASDTQKELYQRVINPTAWDQNPKSAMENWNRMKSLFRDTVSKTIGKTTSEIRSGLRKGSGKAQDLSNEELRKIAGLK